MRQAILLLTTCSDVNLINKASCFLEIENQENNFFILFNQKSEKLPDALKELIDHLYTFTDDVIYSFPFQAWGDSLIPGSPHFALLRFFCDHPDYDYYWVIEDDVVYTGHWSDFFSAFRLNKSDFLSAYLRNMEEDPNWPWWYTLSSASEKLDCNHLYSTFNPCYRISRLAVNILYQGLSEGWNGHFEVLIPTLLRYKGLEINDISSLHDAPQYSLSTYNYSQLSAQPFCSNTLYHPIKEKMIRSDLRRNCVISAVGSNSLHSSWSASDSRSFDVHLIVYDNSFQNYYRAAEFVSYKKGYKLKLVYDYLMQHPDYIEHYNYFFIPDDDILVDESQIESLFDIMEQYQLQIAQPALFQSYCTYFHTLFDANCKLRFTNFVEMMMPCFSRSALKTVLFTFNENQSGWGTEYHWPILIDQHHYSMAIIDQIRVQHTRPITQNRNHNIEELHSYLQKYNLVMKINEYSCIPNDNYNSIQIVFSHHKKRVAIMNFFKKQGKELYKMVRIRRIGRPGLDGMANVCLLFYIYYLLSSDKMYYDYLSEIRSLITFHKTYSSSQESFSYGEDGMKWADSYLFSEIPPSPKEIKEICKVMLKISNYYQSVRPTEIHCLFQELWNLLLKFCELSFS